ncbi:MAG: hypothetical protein AMXMBFR56_14850 [Polyangiaceae bacterium]
MAKLRALPLVLPSDQLTGVAPPAFERALGRAPPGSAAHKGLLHLCASVSAHAIGVCAPPSARAPVLHALATLDAYVLGRADAAAVAKARAELFSALLPLERATADAVRQSLEFEPRQATPIDAHAGAVVVRFAALGAHYAASSAVLTLDAVAAPRDAARVPAQAAGAVAYRFVGLGQARASELRQSACDQASWESERPGAPEGHGAGALAVQLFHEFLGAAWKDVSDAQRLQYFELIDWAMPSELKAS